jgi:hypothetical protein
VKRKSVIIWAAAISVAIHLAFLSALAFTSISPAKQSQNHYIQAAKISSRITYLMNSARVSPKPKIQQPAQKITRTISSQNTSYKTAVELKAGPAQSTVAGEFGSAADSGSSIASAELPDLSRPAGIDGDGVPAVPQGRTEFFGSGTNKRKICYLVDYSGSMQGLFGRVKKELRKSIGSLEQDQYFAVIFFGRGGLVEFEGGKLVRASVKNKLAAYDFIDPVEPAGQADGIAALNKALNIKDSGGSAPQTIYFLTDGFDIVGESDANTELKAAEKFVRNAAGVQINPIAFWPQEQDKKILEVICEQSSGEFVVIADENQLKKNDNIK